MTDLKSIKSEYALSDEELAHIMQISRPSVVKTLNGERQMRVDELLLLAKKLNLSTDLLLGKNVSKYEVFIEEIAINTIKQDDIRISVPQKSYDKFKNALLYILERVGAKPNVGQTVIYKLLYFTDFDYYEKYEEQLIGACYIKNHHGPTPVEFGKIIHKMQEKGEIEEVKSQYFGYDQTKYLPVIEPDLTVFNAQEIKHIDEVIERLADMSATHLSALSHKDVPWITATEGKAIDYESVFYRTSETSVRDYQEKEV